MTIVANFTADVTSGEAPLTVVFTDTSTGSPAKWLWDFGDGFTSDDQHPTHIYESDGLYTIILKAFISSGSSDVATTFLDGRTRNSTPPTWHSTNAAAHAKLLSNPWDYIPLGTTAPKYSVSRNDGLGGFNYNQVERNMSFDLSAFSSGIAVLLIGFSNSNDVPDSGIIVSSGKKLLARTPFNTLFYLEDVTIEIGGTFLTIGKDINDGLTILGTPPDLKKQGWGVASTAFAVVRIFTVSDEDTETKIDFINVGVDPPVAAFSGTPRKKKDSLTTVFDDESTNTPTSWSWKRRPSGIQADYVEFSTDENPSEDFDVTIP